MPETDPQPHRQQLLYWRHMADLKIDACYVRRYRDHVGKRVAWLSALRAVASSGSIAAWVIWRDHAFWWGMIIALSQLADALKDVFPWAKRHAATSEHAATLASMFIDAQWEWENITSGKFDDNEIIDRTHWLRSRHHETEARNFPNGLPFIDGLFAQAEADAVKYLQATYEVE